MHEKLTAFVLSILGPEVFISMLKISQDKAFAVGRALPSRTLVSIRKNDQTTELNQFAFEF